MASVDANVLLRWLLGDVPSQTKKVDALLESGGTYVVEDAALIEVVFVLERVMSLSRASIADAVSTILSTAAFDLDRERWRAVTADYTARPKLSIADIHLAHRAVERRSTPLYTFDRKLAAQLDAAELL